MFPYLILGLALLIGGVILARWFVTANPRQVIRVSRWVLGILAAGLVIFMVFASRQIWAALLLPLLIPLLMNMRGLRHRMRAAQGPAPGQASEVVTRFLRMTLDHDSGAMDGEVLDGRFRGQRLQDLGREQLIALWQECQGEDPQSAAVLEAYMDRVLGDDWRRAEGGSGDGRGGGPMTREEAYRILGLEEGARPEAIREAHRRLMQRVHPDHGGSNYLAAKINEAKALLLGE